LARFQHTRGDLPDIPATNDERATVTQFLQNVRRRVRAKCVGLSEADAQKVPLPTSPAMSIAGVISHLRWGEAFWIDVMFLGGQNRWPGSDRDSELQMRAGHGRPLSELLDEYAAQTAHTDEVIASHDWDAPAAARDDETGRPMSLHSIVMRLIEETAHHNGHLDILRELADGAHRRLNLPAWSVRAGSCENRRHGPLPAQARRSAR
jgi:uncharacterized damage-inducible protein DinB